MSAPDRTQPLDESERRRRDLFEAAYAEYLAAKADPYQPQTNDSDEADAVRLRREQAATRALLSTPAPVAWALLRKWAMVEEILAAEVEGGESNYPIIIFGLAALKADVLAIGLTE